MTEKFSNDSFDSVLDTLRQVPSYPDVDIAPKVMRQVRRFEMRRRLAICLGRATAVAACVAILWGIQALHQASTDTSSLREVVLADTDLSTPEAGAAWLLAAQRPDGSWDTTAFGGRPEHQPALTALGLLALHRQNPEGNRQAVLHGAEALAALQGNDGSFGRGDALRINQGLVTAVLLELNQSLHSDRIGECLADALSFARRSATMGDGAWGYADAPMKRTDGALFAARFPVQRAPALHDALEDSLQALPRMAPDIDENRFYRSCLAAMAIR